MTEFGGEISGDFGKRAHPTRASAPFLEAPDPLAFWTARDRLASDIRAGLVNLEPRAMVDRLRIGAGVDRDMAAAWVERFIDMLARDRARARARSRKE